MLSLLFYNVISFDHRSKTTKSFEQAIIGRYLKISNETHKGFIKIKESIDERIFTISNVNKSTKDIDIPGLVKEICKTPNDETLQVMCSVLTVTQTIDTTNANTYVTMAFGIIIFVVTVAILVYYIYRKTCSQVAQEKAIIRRQAAKEFNLERRLSASISPHPSTTGISTPSTLTLEDSSNSLDNYDNTKK